jgi:hypothetical protein
MNPFKLLLLLATLTLAGCETMTVPECQVADWGRVGFADGARGESESRLAAHVESCASAGVQPNAQAYRQGWDAGIQRFCTAPNGWREGVQGNIGRDSVCRGQPGYEAFSRYLGAGLQVYRTNEQMHYNALQSHRLQRLLEESTKDEEKRRLRYQLRDLDREQYRLRDLLNQQQIYAP